MRLIDADAKIKMLLYDEEHEEQITREMTVKEALDLYTEDGCPTTVEAEPVRHGKWIDVKGSNGKDYRKCSECLHTQDITGLLNYCPVCGAKMEGEEE